MNARDQREPGRVQTGHEFSALATGTRLSDRYTIDHVIAAGGFGITYGGRHEGLGRVVAIKEQIPRQFAYRDGTTTRVHASDPATFSWALDRFLQEGRSLAACKHPHVVDVSDVFEANGTAYMVLAYEDGQSLDKWLRALGRAPTQHELDGILGPLLDSLAFVHAQGLLHRDLAPDNIMIRRDGKPCLIDFGAARHAIAQRSQVLSAIVKSGYSPPEQYTSTGRAQGAWSDIYALGGTLYFAVTGRIPPEATDRAIEDTLLPAAQAVADPNAWRPTFLAGIDAALRLRQAERPQSVEAWRAMLTAASAEAEVRQEVPAVREHGRQTSTVAANEATTAPRVAAKDLRPPEPAVDPSGSERGRDATVPGSPGVAFGMMVILVTLNAAIVSLFIEKGWVVVGSLGAHTGGVVSGILTLIVAGVHLKARWNYATTFEVTILILTVAGISGWLALIAVAAYYRGNVGDEVFVVAGIVGMMVLVVLWIAWSRRTPLAVKA